MKPRFLPTLVILLSTLMTSHPSAAASIQSRVVGLFESEQFDKLEALGARYRESQSRTPSGLWHLGDYYSGLYSVFDALDTAPIFWQMKERAVKNWMVAYPDSPAAHLMYANMLISHGWQIRGVGYADMVKPENWQPFFDYLELAREHLLEHEDIASQDPEWFFLMARIARAQGWPNKDFVAMIDEGLRRHPGYYPLYFETVEGLLPKWGGSVEDIEAFALDAVARTKSTEGYTLYARIYWYASQTQFKDRLFDETRVDWPTMRQGIDDVLAQYPDNWNINNFAYFACLAKDRGKTAELMARIEIPLIRDVWRSGQTYRACKALAQGS